MMIIVLLAAAGSMAFKANQDRATLDRVVSDLKDSLLKTQNYAFAPEKADSNDYLMVLNLHESTDETPDIQYNCNSQNYTIKALSWVIFVISKDPATPVGQISPNCQEKISSGSLSGKPTLSSSFPLPLSDEFRIHFRTSDGAPGFNGYYYDGPPNSWNPMWGTSDYAQIDIAAQGLTKRIKIHKITGQMTICIPQEDGSCRVV